MTHLTDAQAERLWHLITLAIDAQADANLHLADMDYQVGHLEACHASNRLYEIAALAQRAMRGIATQKDIDYIQETDPASLTFQEPHP